MNALMLISATGSFLQVGFTVIPTCGAVAAPVMPQVGPTWGRAERREVAPGGDF